MIQMNIACPHCKKSLMDQAHLIEGHPAIIVTILFENKCGWLRLSSLYGSSTIESEHLIPLNTLTRFFCPHCGSELVGNRTCNQCGAPMVPFKITEGGLVEVCARRGCPMHLTEFENLEAELKAFYDAYSPFM
ncbi:hypothetical protein L0128_13655 [candidate division KSB1 bacterium]|nr:hypothetical protein [candidate division KSB1 bacterium]